MVKVDKLIINIEMYGKDKEKFEELKDHLGLKQNTEVIRAAINHMNNSLIG